MSGFPVTNGVETVMPPPEGYEVNFDSPRQHKVLEHYLVLGIGAPVAFICLCQRYYTKIWLLTGLQIDDGFMFLAWAFSLVTQVLLADSVGKRGLGVHGWEMPASRFYQYSVVNYISAAVFMLCNGFTKLLLLTFYLRLAPQKWWRVTIWGWIVIVALYTSIITLMLFFHCDPVRKAFDIYIQEGTCLDAGPLYIATAATNIITDLILIVLPIPMIYRLRLSLAQKMGAIIIFGIGSMTLATSVVRMVYLPPTLSSSDPSWDNAPANVWSFVEANLFIICGSIPTLRKFFKHFMPRLMGTSDPRSRSYGPPHAIQQSDSRSRKRRQYAQFPEDDENELRAFSNGHHETRHHTAATGVHDIDSSAGDTDNNSENKILQTKSITVQIDSH